MQDKIKIYQRLIQLLGCLKYGVIGYIWHGIIKNAPEVKGYFGRPSFYKRVNVLTLQESAERKNLQ